MKRPRKIHVRGDSGTHFRKTWDYGPDDFARQGVCEWDGGQPWSKRPLSDLQQDQIETLERLYFKFKGRDKQVLGLLLENEINQTKIASILGMKQPNVARAFRNITKKLLEK